MSDELKVTRGPALSDAEWTVYQLREGFPIVGGSPRATATADLIESLEAQLAKERERSGDAEGRYTTSIRAHEATAQERDALRADLARVTAERDALLTDGCLDQTRLRKAESDLAAGRGVGELRRHRHEGLAPSSRALVPPAPAEALRPRPLRGLWTNAGVRRRARIADMSLYDWSVIAVDTHGERTWRRLSTAHGFVEIHKNVLRVFAGGVEVAQVSAGQLHCGGVAIEVVPLRAGPDLATLFVMTSDTGALVGIGGYGRISPEAVREAGEWLAAHAGETRGIHLDGLPQVRQSDDPTPEKP